MGRDGDQARLMIRSATPASRSLLRRLMRPRILIPLLSIVLVLAGVYIYLCFHFPIGSGPAGPAVDPSLFKKPWTDRRVLLLGIGDSVTSGFGVPKNHSYFSRLARNPDDEWPDMHSLCLSAVIPNLITRNLAAAGSNSIDHLYKQVNSLETQKADILGIVVLTTGGNDIIHDYGRSVPRDGAMYGATLEQAQPWINLFRSRLKDMLDAIDGKFPGGCEIFLADIYDPTDGKGVPLLAPFPRWPDQVDVLARYNAVIHEMCRTRPNVHLVPMHDVFLGHGLCCSRFWESCYRSEDPTVWYAFNIEDPNDRGYDAIRRVFLLEIAKVLCELP